MNDALTSSRNDILSAVAGGSGIVSGEELVAINNARRSGARLWEQCLATLELRLERQIFDAYLRPIRFGEFSPFKGVLTVVVSSRFVLNYVQGHFQKLLEEVVADTSVQVCGRPCTLLLKLGQSSGDAREPTSVRTIHITRDSNGRDAGSNHNGAAQPGLRAHLGAQTSSPVQAYVNPRYRFDNFVVGNNNQFVHAAALKVSEDPGGAYNPLFIYGGVGLGKTHLLHAIGNAVLARKPSARVLYLSSETFTNELIQSLRNGRMEDFKSKLRSIELLLIDDIQFICGKERTQEEFFHTFNALYSAHHQIVLTADKVPQEMPGIEERLQTRFSWGLTADLQAPDFETRVAIIKRKASADGLILSEQVSHFIAEQVHTNVRDLEGALTRLHALTSLHTGGSAGSQSTPREITLDMATQALKPFIQKKVVNLSSEDIKRAVALYFGLKTSEMVSKRRTKSISFPRHVAMYLCRKHTTLSYPEIGGQFGGRDHSSVIHAAQVVLGKIESEPSVRKLVSEIEHRLLTT